MFPPQSFDPERANRIRFQISQLQAGAVNFATRLVAIDSALKDNIALVAKVAQQQLVFVNELASLPETNRNYKAVNIKLIESVQAIFRENIENYRNMLASRGSIVQNGQKIELTEEKKGALLAEYEGEITAHLMNFTQEVGPHTNFVELKANLEEKIRLSKQVSQQVEATTHAFTANLYNTLKEIQILARKRAAILEDLPTGDDLWRACEVGSMAHIRFMVYNKPMFQFTSTFINRQDHSKRDLRGREFKVFTALDYAVYREQDEGGLRSAELPSPAVKLETVHYLLANGANPCIVNEVGYQALHWAAKGGDVNIVRALLDNTTYKIDMNCRGEYNRTPLHMAVYNRHLTVVDLLLKRGADVNALTSGEEGSISPLFYAVEQLNKPMVVRLLQEEKICLNIKNIRNLTPLGCSVIHGDTTIASLIVGHIKWEHPKDPKDPDHAEQLIPLLAFVTPDSYNTMKRFLLNLFPVEHKNVSIPPSKGGGPLSRTPSLSSSAISYSDKSVSSLPPTEPIELISSHHRAGIIQDEGRSSVQGSLIETGKRLQKLIQAVGKLSVQTDPKEVQQIDDYELELLKIWSEYSENENALFLSLLARIETFRKKPFNIHLPGNRILGTLNQFSLVKADGSEWPKKASHSSCTINALQFLHHAFGKISFKEFENLASNEPEKNVINQILDQGREHFESILEGRRNIVEQVLGGLVEPSEDLVRDIEGDSISVADVADIQTFFFLDKSGVNQTLPLKKDRNGETTIDQFTELLRNFTLHLFDQQRDSIGYTLTCNGYTYAIVVLRNDAGIEYGVFDSHGNLALNGSSAAFIYWSENVEEAGLFLGNLVTYHTVDLGDLQQDARLVNLTTYGLNQIAVFGFVPHPVQVA